MVIRRPATRAIGVTHATRGWPSTQTVQHPHCPCGLQPSEAIAEDLEQRGVVSLDLDVAPVEGEANQLKLWPQPQVREALGLVIAKPDCSSPSL